MTDKQMNFKKVEQVLWRDVRKNFSRVNVKLAKIIDAIDPGKGLPLLKVTYAFGDRIIVNGKLRLLDDFKNNPGLAKTLKIPNILDSLSYSPFPFGVFLDKTCEVFATVKERIIPLFMLRAGYTIGLFETLNLVCGTTSIPISNITAGSRSIFMLPKINNNLWHKKIERHFNITTPAPTTLSDHWHVFTALANSEAADIDWNCNILFFPKCWIKHLDDKSAGWSQLREYLFKECWLLANPMIGKNFSFLWQQFSLSTIRRNYKPRIYITDTIRHLIGIASNLDPAFMPARDEDSAPIKLIKTAYHEIYNLPYAPTLMEPSGLKHGAPFIYYSLGYPTLLEGNPEVTNIYNTISDLKEIKQLIENMHRYYRDYQQENNDAQMLASILQRVDFTYFHKAQDKYNEIYESTKLPEIDKNFIESSPSFAGKEFCSTSPFFNGCIQIKNTFLG